MHGVSLQGKAAFETTSQITGLFDQQYHWKEPMNIFEFLHEDNHQLKAASETMAFGCFWLCLSSIQIKRFFDQQYH